MEAFKLGIYSVPRGLLEWGYLQALLKGYPPGIGRVGSTSLCHSTEWDQHSFGSPGAEWVFVQQPVVANKGEEPLPGCC